MGFLFIFILFISFDSKPQLWLTSGQSVGLALWSPNSHLASLSSSATTCCHIPFKPAVKCWHAQRHIGFHYFHSYEDATLDFCGAVIATRSLPLHPLTSAIESHRMDVGMSPLPDRLKFLLLPPIENELCLIWKVSSLFICANVCKTRLQGSLLGFCETAQSGAALPM